MDNRSTTDELAPSATCPSCDGDLDDIPPEHRIHNHIELSPEAWARFCELAGIDPGADVVSS